MKRYIIENGYGARIMSVYAEDTESAIAEAERQLSKQGREGLLRAWLDGGRVVKAVTK